MNFKLAGLGAEPKKIAILAALVLVAGYFFISSRTPSDSEVVSQRPAGALPPLTSPRVPARQVTRSSRANQPKTVRTAEEFRPTLKPKKEDEQIDPSTIDPTLRLDLLARLQKIPMEGGTRSLFEIGAAPAVASVKEPQKIVPIKPFVGPKLPPTPAEVAKTEPPPPPVTLKFYGFVNPTKTGDKRAFFLDGEDIIVATEWQMIKNRYKIVRIGVNSAVVEDTQFKNHQSTLPLVEEANG